MYISYEDEFNINKNNAIFFELSGKNYFFWSSDPHFIGRFSDSIKTEFEKYDSLESFLNDFIHDFCGAVIEDKKVILFASLFYPTRYYLYKKEGRWWFTNNADELLQIDKTKNFNNYELLYFLLNGYTTAFSVFYKNWYKLLPGEVISPLEISDNYQQRLEHNLFFKRLIKNTVKRKNLAVFDNTFDEVLKKIVKGKNRIGVLFSGGADSTYVLLKLLSLIKDKTSVTALIFFNKKFSTINGCDDKSKAVHFLEEHNIKYEIIDPLNSETLDASMLQNITALPFDSHLSLWLGGAVRSISAKYDLLITGQNADSIYNFGPTARLDFKNIIRKRSLYSAGMGEFLKRSLYETQNLNAFKWKNKKFALFAKLKFLLSVYHLDNRMLSKMNYRDFLIGFFCQSNYIPYVYSNMFKNITTRNGMDVFFTKTDELVQGVQKYGFSSKIDLLSLKLLSYIQGSDSMVMKGIGNKSNCSVSFPFTEPEAISFFSSYELLYRDTVHPKKCIYEFLDKNNIDLPKQMIKNTNYMTGKQALHLVNTVVFELLNKNSEYVLSIIKKMPDIINKEYLIQEFFNYIDDREYNTDLIFRLLWLSVTFYLL
ncbi:hypothetical protein V1L52_06690 [Treponema sp. HNW]|uniref:hypothetical protein n=1 Tax=Treponema sp. HNW TaxID=3116654 RepID=UPI003D1375B7